MPSVFIPLMICCSSSASCPGSRSAGGRPGHGPPAPTAAPAAPAPPGRRRASGRPTAGAPAPAHRRHVAPARQPPPLPAPAAQPVRAAAPAAPPPLSQLSRRGPDVRSAPHLPRPRPTPLICMGGSAPARGSRPLKEVRHLRWRGVSVGAAGGSPPRPPHRKLFPPLLAGPALLRAALLCLSHCPLPQPSLACLLGPFLSPQKLQRRR